VSAFRPATLALRLQLAEEGTASSRAASDIEGVATGLFWQAIAAGEAGRIPARRTAVREALKLAADHRLRYLHVMVSAYEVPWLAAEGAFDAAERLYEDATRQREHASFPFLTEALVGARLCLDLWRGQAGDLLPTLAAVDRNSPVDLGVIILLLLLRTGQLAAAEQHFRQRPVSLSADGFDAPLRLAVAAEAALLLKQRDVAAASYAELAPWQGRAVSAGTGAPLGPVDSFLALAAAAVGEVELAARHADRALELCAAWHLAPVASWLAEHRHHAGF